MNPTLTTLALIIALAVQAEPAFYQGTIGEKIGINIEVDPTDSHANAAVRYNTGGADERSLEIAPGISGGFPWKEILYTRETGKSDTTGAFTGTMSEDGKSAQGTWASVDGKRSFPFRLTRRAQMLELRSSDGAAKSTYPRFEDSHYSQLNHLLADNAKYHFDACVGWVDEVRDELKASRASRDIIAAIYRSSLARVESVNGDLVSISYRNAEFDGGAHPNTIFTGMNYHIEADGTPKRIGLWDVLKKSDTVVQMLSDDLLAGLNRQNVTFVNDGRIKDFKLKVDGISFIIQPIGIVFMFSPYEVGTAEGDFRVVVPYSRLVDALRADGPLANAAIKIP